MVHGSLLRSYRKLLADADFSGAKAMLDTIGKVKRKEQYEAQLAQIEKDIEKLQKPIVYVAVDEEY